MPVRRILVSLLVLAILPGPVSLPGLAVAGREPADPLATSTIRGVVRDANGTPLAGVTVLAAPLEGDGPVLSATTDAKGRYELRGVRYGHWRLAFRRGKEAWPANRVLLVPPKKKIEANFSLGPPVPEDEALGLGTGAEVPLAGAPAAGVAHLEERLGPSGWAWFKTGRGVAVLIGGGALVVAGVIALADEDDEVIASPYEP